MSIPNVQTYHYQRHEPEKTTLYKLIQGNWLSFQQKVEHDLGYPLPDFVNKEFEAYLRCGILAHGFLRAQCTSCQHEMLVAFSCKKRGFCPSCGARRMSETAAHLAALLGQSPISVALRSKIRFQAPQPQLKSIQRSFMAIWFYSAFI